MSMKGNYISVMAAHTTRISTFTYHWISRYLPEVILSSERKIEDG